MNALKNLKIKIPEKQLLIRYGLYLLIATISISVITQTVHYYKARQAIVKKNRAAAEKKAALEAANKVFLAPIDITAHRLTAEHFVETGRPELALPHYKRILAVNDSDRQLRYDFASACLKAEKYERAYDEFEKLSLEKYVDTLDVSIEARKAISLFYLGKIDESKEVLTESIEKTGGSAEALCYLGQITAGVREDADKALGFLTKSIQQDPLYAEGWYQLARFKMDREEFAEAEKLLKRALEIDPLNGKFHSRLGMIDYYFKKFDEAKKAYLTALALNPGDFNTRYNLGELYCTGVLDTNNAIREFNATIKLKPDHIEANFKLGMICLQNNMTKESIRFLKSAYSADNTNIRVLLQLGVAYEKIGDRERALKAYRKIVALDELNTIARQKVKFLSEK